MKTTLFSIFLSALLLLGCNEAPVQPEESGDPVVQPGEPYELIQMPARAGGGPSITRTESIDGSEGGHVKFVENYITVDGDTVVVDVHLHAHKNSFSGIVDITVTVDDVYAAVKLTPPMIFNDHIDLDLKYQGLDPAQLNLPSGEYEFLFLDDNGNTETVPSHGVVVNAELGEISVKKAKLSHFSRYVFMK